MLALAAAAGVALAQPAVAATSEPARVLVVRVGSDAGTLLEASTQRGSAPGGAVALLAHAERLDAILREVAADPALEVTIRELADVGGLASLPDGSAAEQRWVLSGPEPGTPGLAAVATSALSGGEDDGAGGTLTSDSTRRDGVVVAEDLLPTMRSLAGLPDAGDGGAPITAVDAPVPVDLLDRYLGYRRMSVPIQSAAGLFVTVVGLLGVLLLAARDRAPTWTISAGAWLALAVMPLAVALLMAGHLEELTYGSVLTVVIGGTVLGCVAASLVARRWGTLSALAALGGVTLALFVLEAALGWTAALTTFLGGSQLDGGRFYGLPNVDIGLLLGAGVFLAHRVGGIGPGVAILTAIAVFAGLPFAGADIGGAATFGAAAGLWWGLRSHRPRWTIAMLAVGGAGIAAALTLLANAVLPGAPTHLTSFARGESGGLAATMMRRLQIGFDLIARNPFAIVPVVGVAIMIPAVVRPAAPLRASFDRHPGWREAQLTILWGSVVAYLANDTGAAALSLGFGTALGGLVFVSLRDPPWMMGAS